MNKDKISGDMAKLARRFEAKVMPEPNSGCWIWTGAAPVDSKYGDYGIIRVDKKTWRAHRVSYILYNGDIPDDLRVLHKCDLPICVNPAHLFLGTNSDNMRDMYAKGRHHRTNPIGESNAARKLTEGQVQEIKFGRLSSRPSSDVARLLGVSRGAIDFIRSGKTWSHING